MDVMIRWALRQGMADVTPPPVVWERISQCLNRKARGKRVAWWRRFCVVCRSTALWFLESAVGPPAQLSYDPALDQVRERYSVCLLMYQNDLPMLLGQAV